MSPSATNRVGFFFLLIFLLDSVEAAYPMGSLRCVSTLNRPDLESICPEARWEEFCFQRSVEMPVIF
jgi:hypothetical protein